MHIFERTHVAAITLMSYVSRIHSKIIIAAQIAFVTHLYENQMAIPYISVRPTNYHFYSFRRSTNYAFFIFIFRIW